MKRVFIMANDALLVDVVASVLTVEIGPDVLQLAYRLPRNIYSSVRDARSVLIIVDEGESDNDSIEVPQSFRHEGPLLMIKASLKTMNLDIFKGYRLARPGIEEVMELVEDFIRTYLKKKSKGWTNAPVISSTL